MDGEYPDDKELDKIKNWQGESLELMEYIKPMWKYFDCGYWIENKKTPIYHYELSTGGWSGNEDIIGAMMENTLFWIKNWYQSRRGGHYIFKIGVE